MFGEILGKIVSAPIRVVNIPVKLAQKAAQIADESMCGESRYSYKAPRKNCLDKLADATEDACEESLER